MTEKGYKVEAFYKLIEHPVYMAVATKAGCTYLKNLFYYINAGQVHPLGDQIHKRKDQLLRGEPEDLPIAKTSPYVFMVVRNPVQRFFSLYFDKIYNFDQGESFGWFRERYAPEIGLNLTPDIDKEAHQKNLSLMIDFIDKNLKGETPYPIDGHWRRQYAFYNVVKNFQPKLIPLESLSDALPMLLEEEIPNIREAMQAVNARNKSKKPFETDELRNWPLTKRIRSVYAQDMRLHKRAKQTFREMQEAHENANA